MSSNLRTLKNDGAVSILSKSQTNFNNQHKIYSPIVPLLVAPKHARNEVTRGGAENKKN
jgi:hypothetical protein